jgi:2-iminobutanoate/2-iminopropanoate deaminase
LPNKEVPVKEVISTDAAPAAVGPYSQAVRAGDFFFVSGQIGLDPNTGTMVEGGVVEQCIRVLDNLKAILQAGGLGMEAVVKTTVYLQSIGDFKAVNEVYRRYFAGDYPARAAFEVGALPLGALVEIEAVAYAG